MKNSEVIKDTIRVM